jgi:hypothetical protein
MIRLTDLSSLRKEQGQAIYDFLAQMEGIWDQLTLCEPTLKDPNDARMYDDYHNRTSSFSS